jgi:hypothetical protein
MNQGTRCGIALCINSCALQAKDGTGQPGKCGGVQQSIEGVCFA